MESKRRKEIRNLLLVIGSGVGCALALALMMLYFYNPTGRYLAKNLLLSPQIMSQIAYPETNAQTGEIARYIFDGFEFAYYEPVKKEWLSASVGREAYTEFYNAVSEDLSILPISEEMQELFKQGTISSLRVHMREERAKGRIRFQEVDFAAGGDFYRVHLRQQASEEAWAYFFHPGIERYARAVFNP
jgi:hypothetical protein